MHAMLADRAEQGLGEAAVTAIADHEQVRAVRGVDQRLRRMPVDDQAPHPLAVGRPDFLVMGSCGRSDLTSFILGSTTHKVTHLTDRPVLVIR